VIPRRACSANEGASIQRRYEAKAMACMRHKAKR